MSAGSPNAFARMSLSIAIADAGVYYTGTDGRLYVNIPAQWGEFGAMAFSGVPVLTFGGTAGRFLHVGRPTAQAAAPADPTQVVLLFVGASKRPFGALDLYAAGVLATEGVSAEANADRGQVIGPADHALKNGGGAMILDGQGRIALIAGNNPDIGAELGEGGKFRISRGGNGTGVPVLRTPLLSYLNTLTERLETIQARLSVVEAAIPIIPVPDPVIFPDPDAASLGSAAVRFPSTAE